MEGPRRTHRAKNFLKARKDADNAQPVRIAKILPGSWPEGGQGLLVEREDVLEITSVLRGLP